MISLFENVTLFNLNIQIESLKCMTVLIAHIYFGWYDARYMVLYRILLTLFKTKNTARITILLLIASSILSKMNALLIVLIPLVLF